MCARGRLNHGPSLLSYSAMRVRMRGACCVWVPVLLVVRVAWEIQMVWGEANEKLVKKAQRKNAPCACEWPWAPLCSESELNALSSEVAGKEAWISQAKREQYKPELAEISKTGTQIKSDENGSNKVGTATRNGIQDKTTCRQNETNISAKWCHENACNPTERELSSTHITKETHTLQICGKLTDEQEDKTTHITRNEHCKDEQSQIANNTLRSTTKTQK